MDTPDLLSISLAAFVAVFLLLSFLALIMRLITGVFPKKESDADSSVIAALSTTMNTIYPGTKITKIEEVK